MNLRTPTLPDILRTLLLHGMDRGSLVREPIPGRAAGVGVFMLSPAAIHQVGNLLRALARQLPDQGADARFTVTPETSLTRVFEVMEQLGHQWTWSHITIDRADALLFFLVGPAVTEDLCRRLTAAGVPTSLQ